MISFCRASRFIASRACASFIQCVISSRSCAALRFAAAARDTRRVLHDDAGQALTSLILDIGMLKQIAADPEAVKTHAAHLGKEAASVLENLHRLAMDLRPATLDHLGLVPSLRQYIELTASQSNINIQFEAIGSVVESPTIQ